MRKDKTLKTTNRVLILTLFVLAAASCTKKREASLPEDVAPTVFSISEFGDVQPEKSNAQFQTMSTVKELSSGDQAKAVNEKGIVEVDSSNLAVSDRLRFMFSKLEIPGTAGSNYRVTFAVDREFVTAYKVVQNIDELTIVEKALALTPSQVSAQLALQKTFDQKEARNLIAKIKATTKVAPLLVPIFKYKVIGYGTLQRTKNELKEETSVLTLTRTDWSLATHIAISNNLADRLPITVSAGQKEELDQIFVMNKVNNKVMDAETLEKEFGISTNLKSDTKILTRLDTANLYIYEISTSDSADISEAEKLALKNNTRNQRVEKCSDDVKLLIDETQREKCVIINRFSYPITYVNPSLSEVSYDGSQSNALEFKPVLTKNNVGLVKIIKNAVPTINTAAGISSGIIDPRYSIRVSDIKGKEFFFRRTFEQSTTTAKIISGMMGDVDLVQFQLEENRLVVRKTVQVIDFRKDKSALDQEEVLSFPAKYYREVSTDGAGNTFSSPQVVSATKENAELIEIDWTHNTIPVLNSPLAYYADGQCFRSINDQSVSNLDQRLAQNGVLNFSYIYSVTIDPDCASSFDGMSDYSMQSKSALVQGVKERISFKLNDGQTDKSYVPNTPFPVQNNLGYGVFTTGNLKPSENGIYGRDGSQINLPMSHDFRNGKTITYTIGGLPENEGRYLTLQNAKKIDLRETYIQVAQEVIADWNKALHRAFDGTPLARSGDYINYVINGENGLDAKLGDLDRHFIWFENTVNTDMGVLGVSQAGLNPKSGIITADAVIIYAANINYYIEYDRRNLKLLAEYNKKVDAVKKEGQKLLEQGSENAGKSSGTQATSSSVVNSKINYINKLVSYVSSNNNAERFTPANILSTKKLALNSTRYQMLNQKMKSAIGLNKNMDINIAETDKAYIHRIVKKALSMDLNDQSLENVELLTAQEILKSYENSNLITALEKSALKTKVKMMEVRKRLTNVYKNRPGCLTIARETLASEYLNMSFRDAIIASTKPTLAHEMGHSLGLTHNFIASTDSKNFIFSDEKKDTRNYSSVMDYMGHSQLKYAGPGPYDVYAIRASYTGLLESEKGFISIDKIKESVGGQWTSFNKILANKIPFKKYKYCTDFDVLWEPTCQRHDYGTTASEIVDNLIKDYNNHYVIAYHDYDRLKFGYAAKINAISYTMDNMIHARQFLDESFYKAIVSKSSQEELADYFEASKKVYRFLLSVIHTPDAEGLYADNSRFSAVPYTYQETVKDAKGQEKVVERKDVQVVEKKSVNDISIDSRRIDTIGIEEDKILAMEILTLKGFPSSKYIQASLALSYLDFEKYILGIDDPSQSLIVGTLTEILNNNLTPAMSNDKVMLTPLPADFKSDISNAMRIYAGISAILSLESTTLKEKDNFATLFKVATSKGLAPKDRLSISQTDADDKSTQKINYFAVDNALVANELIREEHRLLTIIKNSKPIQKVMSELLSAQVKTDKALVDVSKDKLLKMLNAVNVRGEILSAEDLKKNPKISLDNQINIVSLIFETYYASESGRKLLKTLSELAIALQKDPKLAQDEKVKVQIQELLRLKSSNEALAKALPVLAMAQRALGAYVEDIANKSGADVDMATLSALKFFLADDDFESRYGITLNSIDFLSKLTRMTNPELSR